MPRKKNLGAGAKCTVAMKYLHPAKLIADTYPNRTTQSVLENLCCFKKGERKIRRKDADVVFFWHDRLKIIIYRTSIHFPFY